MTGPQETSGRRVRELTLPNETESLGDVFDHLTDETYASEWEAPERFSRVLSAFP
jgi:hypothetical protein